MSEFKLGGQALRLFYMVSSSDHITPFSGGPPTVTIAQAGGSFVSPQHAASSLIANGMFSQFLVPQDLNTLGELAWHITASGADPVDFVDQVVIHPQGQNVGYGSSDGPGAKEYNIDSSGNLFLSSPLKQNRPYNGLIFIMTKISDGTAATGLTVTATRSLAGGVFAPCVNSPTELSNGAYSLNLGAADTNAAVLMLRLTAPTANDLNIPMITQL